MPKKKKQTNKRTNKQTKPHKYGKILVVHT